MFLNYLSIITHFLFLCKFFMKKSFSGFTLVELLVVIAIIMILVLGISRIDLNPQINKQKFLEFNNQISSSIEYVRNNSLIWKWVWPTLQTPTYWNIYISTANNWSLVTTYNSWWTNFTFTWNIINFNKHNIITWLDCKSYDLSNLNSPSSVNLRFEWANIFLTWWCNNNSTILDIKTKNWSFTGVIRVNTLNWLIEKL